MNDMDEKQLIDDLEKESMLELEVMHESENTDNERIIEDAKSKIEKLFDDVRNSFPADIVCLNCSLSLTSTTLSFVEERISFASSFACDNASLTFSGSEASFNKSRRSSNNFSIYASLALPTN